MTKLIESECNNMLPLCVHHAFLVDNMVIHNTPAKKNIHGGNIIIEPFDDFKSNRKILSIKDIDTPSGRIFDYYEANKGRKFNSITFNCEQFVNDVIYGKKGLSVLTKIVLIVSTLVILSKKNSKKV